jgi:hypothetical protein
VSRRKTGVKCTLQWECITSFLFLSWPGFRYRSLATGNIPTKWNSFSSSSGKAVGHIAARNCSILSLLQGRDLGSYFNLDFQFQGLETKWKDFEYIVLFMAFVCSIPHVAKLPSSPVSIINFDHFVDFFCV